MRKILTGVEDPEEEKGWLTASQRLAAYRYGRAIT
jgi:hypothetical protein